MLYEVITSSYFTCSWSGIVVLDPYLNIYGCSFRGNYRCSYKSSPNRNMQLISKYQLSFSINTRTGIPSAVCISGMVNSDRNSVFLSFRIQII